MYLPSNDPLVQSLVESTFSIPTVDCHQHLSAETPIETDLCRMIVEDNYLLTDLVSAGLSEALKKRVADPTVPLGDRWMILLPFWKQVWHSSYAQAHLIAMRDLYGLSYSAVRSSYSMLLTEGSTRLSQDFARSGLYHRILSERCGIDRVLTQGGAFDYKEPRFFNVARPLDRADFSREGAFETDAGEHGIELSTVDHLIPAMDAILRNHRNKGAVGFKIAALPWKKPSPAELNNAFIHRDHTEQSPVASHPLMCLYVSRIAALAAEWDLPVAVHTGAPWTNWLDFRAWEPTEIIPLLLDFRETKFDLYHAGIPFGTQASMLGKAFPNVWHNLAWAHVISSELAMRSIAEWLDLIPLNKILAFGGDYHNRTVILTYGHLMMARYHLARVLGYRVKDRHISEEEAKEMLHTWFSENPRRLYRL